MPERSTGDPYVLTDAGWPRPRVAGLPVPWVAPTHNLGEVNDGRRLASVGGAICQVCGEGWQYGEQCYGFVSGDELAVLLPGDFVSELDELNSASPIFFLDGALMHDRCARLTAAMCPHVASRTDLFCVRMYANDANPAPDPVTRKLSPSYPAGDVQLVAWPTKR